MYQKYKANESTSKHNPKKKWNRTHSYEMTINITKKTQDEKIVICHKSTNDEGALAIICGGDEEPQPSAAACWKIAMDSQMPHHHPPDQVELDQNLTPISAQVCNIKWLALSQVYAARCPQFQNWWMNPHQAQNTEWENT
jgi:hypothetical protein